MADFRLKVSEQDYRTTIDNLKREEDVLQGALEKLQGMRIRLERGYTGPTAAKAVEAVKSEEARTTQALNATRRQREDIEGILERMNQEDSDIRKKFEEAKAKIDSAFN